MTDEGVKKKRDPIFSVCFVVFILACVGVLGTFIDQHYIEEDDTVAAYGDTVVVDYTGSFYAYLGEDNAVVFDTSVKSVGNDDNVVKSNGFSKTSYSTLSVTIGSKSALTLFENSLVGHKEGDMVRVTIPVGEGYNAPAGSIKTDSTSQTLPLSYTISKTVFEDQYEDVSYTAGQAVKVTSVYGWDALAVFNSTENNFTIYNMPVAGQTYQYAGNDDSKFGNVSFAVTSVTDSTISYTISFSDYKTVDGGIQMIELSLDGNTCYVTAVGNGTYTYKTCDEVDNEVLYFTIKIKSIN